MGLQLAGKVWLFDDNIDTDVILPGPYMTFHDAESLGRYAMAGIDPDFSKRVSMGDILVAGRNFGCGSSREHAPLALKGAGISAVIVESFSRIFFRNSLNIGLPVLECPGIRAVTEEGDSILVDVASGRIYNERTKKELIAVGLPDFVVDIITKGGIVPYLREQLVEEGN